MGVFKNFDIIANDILNDTSRWDWSKVWHDTFIDDVFIQSISGKKIDSILRKPEEKDDTWKLSVNAGGLSKDNIEGQIEKNSFVLTINYPEDHPLFPKEKTEITLDIKSIDSNIIDIFYNNGLISVFLPIKEESKKKSITCN